MRSVIFVFSISILFGCKRGPQGVVALKNASQENVYFIVSASPVLNDHDVSMARPVKRNPGVVDSAGKSELDAAARWNLYRYLVEKDSTRSIVLSESAGIFVNSISVASIIEDRYNGAMNIFVINESDLLDHTDEEVIKGRLYTLIRTLKPSDVRHDTLLLTYR